MNASPRFSEVPPLRSSCSFADAITSAAAGTGSVPEVAEVVATIVAELEDRNHWRQLLLALTTYFYATGVYSSDAVSERIRQGCPALADTVEDWSYAIRHFRRNHRDQIERCLTEVLGRLHGATRYTTAAFSLEATARLNRAIREDSWNLDF